MEFKNYHPIINFIYFAAVITFSMFIMHPAYLAASLLCACIYLSVLRKRKALKLIFALVLPLIIISAIANPLFNHEGISIICYFPNGNPLTLESVFYGIAAGTMLASVMCWFSCMTEVVTSDKIIYLFGKIIPALSLIFSMALRFVPRFTLQLKLASASRPVTAKKGIISKLRHCITVLSAAVTWALESSVDTADSMKARGYGLSGRTSFSVFKFSPRDKSALLYMLVLAVYILIFLSLGTYFRYFPSVKYMGFSFVGISCFAAYVLLFMMPVIIELWEAKKWKK